MRRSLIAKIKIAQKELKLDNETYRAVLLRVTGKLSCTDMGVAELEAVLTDMQAHGFKPKPKAGIRPKRRKSADGMLRKVEALILDNGWSWNYAHCTAKRMFGVDRVQWLSDENLWKLVAALQIAANRKAKAKETAK